LLLVVYNVSFGLSPVCVHYWVTIESCHSWIGTTTRLQLEHP
jgi:hypothetical protein